MNTLSPDLDNGARQAALLTVRQMAEADRLSVVAGVSSFELMSNAGAAVAHEIQRRWTPRPLLVLCGPGNNGGDGFVCAYRLAQAGWPVRVAMWGSRAALKGEAGQHAQRWPGEVQALSPAVLEGAELIVDAVFGAGLARALEGQVLDTLAAAGRGTVPIVAVDTPSGVMGDSGESLGAVAAVLTVTFFRKKPGHLLLPGRDLCGEVIVADIGTPEAVLDAIVPQAFENHPGLWLPDLPRAGLDTVAGHPPVVAADATQVLTLHESEFRRMFDFVGDKLTRTRAAAQHGSAVVVHRGSDTVIACPDGRAVIHCSVPSAATGELLGGIIRWLRTQGMPVFPAAAAGVWLHDVAAAEFGPGLLAKEVPNLLPGLLRRLYG